MHQEVFEGLKKIPFFASLSDEMLKDLAGKAKSAKFSKGAHIVNERDVTSSLYIILEGRVRVYSSDDKSKEVTLLLQDAGSYFGELALLTDEPRSASVVALTTTVCGVINKPDFLNWLGLYPDAAINLLIVLADKVRHLTEKVKQMALSNVYERVIKVLLELAQEQRGMTIIPEKLTQQDLANMVGSSREMVNKVMTELTKGGYISVEEKCITILKKPPSSW